MTAIDSSYNLFLRYVQAQIDKYAIKYTEYQNYSLNTRDLKEYCGGSEDLGLRVGFIKSPFQW